MLTRALAVALLAASVVSGALFGTAGAASPPSVSAPKGPPRVTVSLISDSTTIEPGSTFWVGLHQHIAPGWHTYWINPGDSGEPPSVEWSLPSGFTAEPIMWPAPERVPVGPFMSYGYTNEVVLPIRITAPESLDRGTPVTLRGHASWLVCEKTCIPEEADVILTLPVAAGRPAPGPSALVEHALRTVPEPSPWAATFQATPDTVTLSVAAPGLAVDRIVDVSFFPMRWGVIEHAAPQEVSVDARGITLRMARGLLPEATATDVDGVLIVRERLDQGTVSQAFAIRAAVGRPSAATSSGPLTLAAALGLALAGGLILNLMPCVLPVLSVKAVALVAHAHTSVAAIRRHGVAYTCGVLTSFGGLAATLIALRAGGAEIGWGFQLQSPLVVTALAYVLFALALSLSGVLVIGARLTGVGHDLASRPGYAGSFFTGVLATVAATPCTAPFMGVAIGFALTQPPAEALAIFEALGLGLALPFLALSMVPAWRRFLPRPGRWMERLRQMLALPLYGAVAWLVWVVSRQAGLEGAALVLAGLLLIGVAAWLHHGTRVASPRWRRAAVALALGCVAAAITVGPLAASNASSTAAAAPRGARWESFTPGRLAELRAQGIPVFVNATAAWCITCLVNERVALHSPAVAAAFASKGVVYLKADWTSKSPKIAALLESFGRSGVPLYVFYGKSAREPQVLPQILSERTLIEAVEHL
ncbi:MAG TPA: protein-disulfide reductase DsbD domain-containing protein [Candidatus Methylomirabilis sp.]|nr:protein-disulfide reductase DsbD domain-containing protein [Candidatus Methylomirabilis sp.]